MATYKFIYLADRALWTTHGKYPGVKKNRDAKPHPLERGYTMRDVLYRLDEIEACRRDEARELVSLYGLPSNAIHSVDPRTNHYTSPEREQRLRVLRRIQQGDRCSVRVLTKYNITPYEAYYNLNIAHTDGLLSRFTLADYIDVYADLATDNEYAFAKIIARGDRGLCLLEDSDEDSDAELDDYEDPDIVFEDVDPSNDVYTLYQHDAIVCSDDDAEDDH